MELSKVCRIHIFQIVSLCVYYFFYIQFLVWEVSNGRCLKTIQLNGCIKCVQSSPGAALSLLAVACDRRLLLISPGRSIGDYKVAERTDELLAEAPDNSDVVGMYYKLILQSCGVV